MTRSGNHKRLQKKTPMYYKRDTDETLGAVKWPY